MVAFPIAYLLAQHWLDSFAYKISLEWWYFAITAFIVLLMAWIAVGIQIFKLAKLNPAAILKQ